MANIFVFTLIFMLSFLRVEPCYIPDSLYVPVPQQIQTDFEITKVGTANCDSKTLRLTLSDESFELNNGRIVALTDVYVGAEGRTFYVRAEDGSGPRSEMEVHLFHSELQKPKPKEGLLKRTKRRWSPPPFNILENDRGPFPKNIEHIVSDSSGKQKVYYTFSGPGYDKPPIGVFSLDSQTGMLKVHQAVDREMFPNFTLTTRVFKVGTVEETDDPLDILIIVDDVNDNPPEFKSALQYTVMEHSKLGTTVGKVEATDRDQERTQHVKIKYSLLTGSDLFSIHPATGVITTKVGNLDREVKDKYLVTVLIKDMDGAPGGLSNSGTATIEIGDINDNPPTFTKASYNANVKENEKDKLILRIPVEDKDLVNTANWKSKFIITKGNENGNFRMETDPKTNEGLLYVDKPLDFEKNKNVKLELMARNEAELNNTDAKWQTVPVDIAVTDVDEGPEFTAPTVRFTVKENIPNGTLIGSYTAIDPETKSSDGIKYYKLSDPAGWINVDKNTGELRVANTIDRESHFVQNGIYNITMKAVDVTSKTGTGMVIIKVEDVNDNVPTLPTKDQVICEKDRELGTVYFEAEDKDESPFSSPFRFTLPTDNDGKWSVENFNGTTAKLKQIKELPTGIYQVPIHVTDLQGFGKTQTLTVRICQCRNGVCLSMDRSATLGGLGVLAMLLPLLLLLLLCLLLGLFCVTKREKREIEDTGDSGGILLQSNTEGRGDEVDASLMIVPTTGVGAITKGSINDMNAGPMDFKGMGGYNGGDSWRRRMTEIQDHTSSHYGMGQYGKLGGQHGQLVNSGVSFDSRYFQDSTFHFTWKTNERYLNQKMDYFARAEDGRYADDIIHSYGFEGAGSTAGSVGCCSEIGDNDNLDFLNTLGPKFKTLADTCKKT